MADKQKTQDRQNPQKTQDAQEKPQKPVDKAIAEALEVRVKQRQRRKQKPADLLLTDPTGGVVTVETADDRARPSIDASEQFNKAVKSISTAISKLIEIRPELEELAKLLPYIEKLVAAPEYADKGEDVGGILDALEAEGTDQDGHIIPGSQWEKLINDARAALERDTEPVENQQSKRPKNTILPVDKFNTTIFADWLDLEKQLHGQIAMFPVKMEADANPHELTLYFDIRYPEELPDAERKLTPTDRRVYNATYWLQKTNGNIMSVSQMFRAAGFGETPNSEQINRIKKSIDKMRRTTTKWDNKEEATAYKKDGTFIEYDGYLYPVELISERRCFNGRIVDSYIKVLKPLPLIEFAIERKQVAQIPPEIIQTKLRATDLNIALEDYIIARLERNRNKENRTAEAKKGTHSRGEYSEKILYETLYKGIGANTRQKQRTALKNLFVYLDELKEKNYIKSYREDKTKSTGEVGVIINY